MTRNHHPDSCRYQRMKQTNRKASGNFVKREFVLLVFLFLLVVLAVFYPGQIIHYPSFIHWNTIMALAGLLIIATGLKESGYFSMFSRKVLKRLRSERSLALFLVFFSAFLSAFLTNDITLFIVVPLTFSIQDLVKNDISRLIIFEAIAVNAGSALTPIGNPQNIFLWHQWDISFPAFVMEMIPVVFLLLSILFLFVWFVFPGREISFSGNDNRAGALKRNLFLISVVLLAVFAIALEMGKIMYLLPVVFLFYLIFYVKVLFRTDWLLLFLFMIIFIDFHLISVIPAVSEWVGLLNLNPSGNVFLFSGFVSQLISNMPAAVFVSKFSDNWPAITYGVNVAGNGLVVGSLANIIALRMADDPVIWLKFHRYSIPFFLVSGALAYVLFFIL